MTGPGKIPVNLAVFDVDGTLTQTYEDDTEAFLGAVRQVFGFEDVRVSGQGSTRHSEARWSGSDTRALLPSQITSVSEVDDT